MGSCEVWDVVRVPFLYTNRPVQQYRPALVIAKYNQPRLLWVLMITSASHRRWDGDVLISDLKTAGLTASSIIRTAKLATIAAAAADRLGALPIADRDQVRTQLTARLPTRQAH